MMDPLTIICGLWNCRRPRVASAFLALAVILLVASFARSEDKKDAAIIFPPNPAPTPQPKPPANTPVMLDPSQTYVVRANLPVRVLSSDESILSVSEDSGPIKIRAIFYPDKARTTKTFTEKQVFSVDPLAEGAATLLIVPADSAMPVIRIKIQVGPLPPPPNPVTISISPTSATVPVGGKQQFTATASQGGVTWKLSGVGTVDTSGLFTASTATAGNAQVVAQSTIDPSKTATATVTVTDTPPPNPAPIPVAGFRVLMVYDKATLKQLPAAQRDVLYSEIIRDYLNAKTVKGPDGQTYEYRCYHSEADLKNESALWQNAMARPRKSLPWIVISDGKTGFEGPLPVDVVHTLALLKQYGG